MGQRSESPDDLNLGAGSLYNGSCAGFTPEYLNIATDITTNDSSQSTAVITTDDGYFKEVAGQPVSFTVSDITNPYGIDNVSITDASGNTVDLSESSGDYSFTMPVSDVTIHVVLKQVTPDCVVNFTNEGTTYTSINAVSGDVISAPVAPVKAGYSFHGWYADENLTTPVTFPYKVTGNTTLYAKWIIQYTVTFVSSEPFILPLLQMKAQLSLNLMLPSNL
jgi:uncharacterized repeat protein (TIGR02543 family)